MTTDPSINDPAPPTGAPTGRPATLAERRQTQPVRRARLTIDLAVRMLPPAHRTRYALEFYADLASVPKNEQTRQALSILTHIQQLAWALGDPSPEYLQRRAAKRRSIRCTLALHHYARRHILHPEDGVHWRLECTRCHKDRFLPHPLRRAEIPFPPPPPD